MNNSLATSVEQLNAGVALCQALLKTKVYAKIGAEGIFTLIMKARSLGMDPLDAVGGGLYYVHGKVELSAQAMNSLIRAAGHHVTKDTASDDSICILHGKRADNGDTMTSTFSIEDAKRAGIYKATWLAYPQDMLFARALSRLGRQLFPDVLKGCYVEGEIKQAMAVDATKLQSHEPTSSDTEIIDVISTEQVQELEEILANCSTTYVERVKRALQDAPCPILSWAELSPQLYERIKAAALKNQVQKEELAEQHEQTDLAQE